MLGAFHSCQEKSAIEGTIRLTFLHIFQSCKVIEGRKWVSNNAKTFSQEKISQATANKFTLNFLASNKASNLVNIGAHKIKMKLFN